MLSYLRVNYHEVYDLISNSSGKKPPTYMYIYTYGHIYVDTHIYFNLSEERG